MLKKYRWLALLAVLVMAAATACGGSGDGEEEASSSASGANAPDDVPEVVAEVNGEEIPRQDFVDAYEMQSQQAAAQSQSGKQPDEDQLRKQVVQGLINEELLNQEADRREITASDEQVQDMLTELAQSNGMQSADDFVAALEKQGMDREEIDAQAAQQTRFDLLVSDEAGDVSASDKEVRTLYEQLKSQQSGSGQGGKLPPLDKVRPQLEDQIESQKESRSAQQLIDRLRKDADITVNL